MPLKVWNGSAWQVQAQIKVWNGSSWVSTNALNNAKSAKVWNGSSWVQFHPGVRLDETSTGSGISIFSFDAQQAPFDALALATISIDSSGTMDYSDNSGTTSYTWLLSGANSDYYAYMDAPSGDPFTFSAGTNTSLQLNTSRSWSLEAFNPVNNSTFTTSLTSTLRIKNSAGTDILSISVALECEAQKGIPP
jgi:hypothetical protein